MKENGSFTKNVYTVHVVRSDVCRDVFVFCDFFLELSHLNPSFFPHHHPELLKLTLLPLNQDGGSLI